MVEEKRNEEESKAAEAKESLVFNTQTHTLTHTHTHTHTHTLTHTHTGHTHTHTLTQGFTSGNNHTNICTRTQT